MTPKIPLGPALGGTLVSRDIDATVRAYCDYLHTTVLEDQAVTAVQANLWGKPRLAGAPLVTLQSASGYPWVRVLGSPDVVPAQPFKELGWMALEVLVEDVDGLAEQLRESPFRIFREPANLDVSDQIRAMQVIGPAGEVLYLTQVNGAVPPFDIPRARCAVDRLFIPVSSCLHREEAIQVYKKLGAMQSWRFDTRISSVNQALGMTPSLRHPVATVQLAGQCMVEVDQLGLARARPPGGGGFAAGIALVSFLVDDFRAIDLPAVSPPRKLEGRFYGGQSVMAVRGAAGELIELIEAVF